MKPQFKGTPGPWKICCYGHEYKELVIEKDKKPEIGMLTSRFSTRKTES